MKNLASKTHAALLLIIELICGILCFVLAAVVTVLLIMNAFNGGFGSVDDITVTIVVLVIFYLLCLAGGVWLISRFIKWKKLPEVLIAADDENLYIYTNKEVKIAFGDVESVFAGPESLFVQIFGGGYGVVEVNASSKKYKVRFVDQANTVPDTVMSLINKQASDNLL
ncbi:MAG: hypothetical protein ACI4MH_06745 [Candidatus Coproplasma sp.]